MNDDAIDIWCCVRISKDNIIDSFDKLSLSSSIAKNTCTFSDHMEAILSIDSKFVPLIAQGSLHQRDLILVAKHQS